jgi:colanic acid biosynthesis glycosyl transferase WcaI
LKANAERHDLKNVRFFDYVPREDLAQTLSAAGASLVTEDSRVVGLLLPSKTYGILASGRPILFVGDRGSDVATIVRRFDCGEIVDPADPVALAATIVRLSRDPATCAAMGERARAAAVTELNRRQSYAAWSRALGALS